MKMRRVVKETSKEDDEYFINLEDIDFTKHKIDIIKYRMSHTIVVYYH